MRPSLYVPPQASLFFSFFVNSLMSIALSSMPSTMVLIFPNFFFSDLTTIFCVSFAMLSQTQSSLGSPQVGQISLILFDYLLGFVKSVYSCNIFLDVSYLSWAFGCCSCCDLGIEFHQFLSEFSEFVI